MRHRIPVLGSGGIVATSEGAPAVPADAVEARGVTSLAKLLTGHILRDGEVVLLILKPSWWFIPLISLRFVAAVVILMIAARVYDDRLPHTSLVYLEAGLFLIVARLLTAILQWTARLYVLTDLRIVRISGVFSVDVFDCALRKVARTRVVRTARERVTFTGSIEIIPIDDDAPIGLWQTVARPLAVHKQILMAIRRAKQGG